MIRARTGFDAVQLGDGTVLVVGDDFACHPGGAVPGSERAELYDPIADTWVEVASLNKPRKSPATVALPDGSAMVLGGINSDDVPFSSTKIFSPETRTWTNGPLLDLARSEPLAAALADGRVIVAGSGDRTTSEIYDPARSSWERAAALPPNTDIRDIVSLSDGRVLALGFDHVDADPVPAGYLYDPQRDGWTAVEAPGVHGYVLAALTDGGALAIGGTDDGVERTSDRVRRFDPGSGRWAPVAPMLTPRIGPQVAVLDDGRMLVAGGAITQDDEIRSEALRSTEIFDPTTNGWSTADDLLEPREGGLAVVLEDGSVLVLGGSADFNTEGEVPWCPTPLTTVERFDRGP